MKQKAKVRREKEVKNETTEKNETTKKRVKVRIGKGSCCICD